MTYDRVLVVDDDPADRALLIGVIEQIAPTAVIDQAATLDDAISLLDRGDADCLFLDLGLPGRDDLEALQEVVPLAGATPVIVVTGQTDDSLVGRALGMGAQDYVVKDEVRPEVIARAMRHAIERQRLYTELRAHNRRLKILASLVSHDLRGKAASTAGLIGLAADVVAPDLPEREARLVTTAHSAATAMQGLLGDLLAYLGSSDVELSPQPVADVVQEAIADAVDATGTSATVVCDDADGAHAIANRTALRHVLRNLLVNALTYTHPDRVPEVRVDVHHIDDLVEIRVIDNGIGIDRADRQAVFDIGVRKAPRVASGSGLGLSAVATLVADMDGRVVIEDTPSGVGTCVRVRLPGAARS